MKSKHCFTPALLLVVGLIGCGKEQSRSGEISLPEMNRNLQGIIMAGGKCPSNVSELTNFPAFKEMRLPTLPPGKKLAIDRASQQVVFVDN